MNEVKIAVGGEIKKEMTDRFVDAWHQAERGGAFEGRYLAFENWDTLARVLTAKRMELLGHVRRHKIASIRALAKGLQRDYSNVHADVQALASAGLLESKPGSIRANYDSIETKITI